MFKSALSCFGLQMRETKSYLGAIAYNAQMTYLYCSRFQKTTNAFMDNPISYGDPHVDFLKDTLGFTSWDLRVWLSVCV